MLTSRRLACVLVASTTAATLVGLGTPALASTPSCYGKHATIVLSKSNKSIKGTKGNDVIVVTGKNDTVDGKGGKDLVCGKDLKKVTLGKGGPDKVQIASGTVNGGSANDAIEVKGSSSKPAVLSGGGGVNSYKVPATALKRVTIKPGILGDTLNGQPFDLGLPTSGPEAYLRVDGDFGYASGPAVVPITVSTIDGQYDYNNVEPPESFFGNHDVTIHIDAARAPAGSAIASWSLDAGDGSPVRHGAGEPPQQVSIPYIKTGPALVTLSLTDTLGRSSTRSLPLTIATAPTVTLSATPPSAAGPVSFALSATAMTGLSISRWALDFNDGSAPLTGTGPVPATASHQYPANGTFYPSLDVEDTIGGTSGSSAVVTYAFGAPGLTVSVHNNRQGNRPGEPLINAGPGALTVEQREYVSFNLVDDDAEGDDVVWGDGTTYNDGASDPSHSYDAPGTYLVTFRAHEGSTVRTASVQVHVLPTEGLVTLALPSVVAQGPVTIPVVTSRLAPGSTWLIAFSDGNDPLAGSGPLPASIVHTFNPVTGTAYFPSLGQSAYVTVTAPDGASWESDSWFTVTGPQPSLEGAGFGEGYSNSYQGWSPIPAGRAGYAAASFAGGSGHRIANVSVSFGDGASVPSVPGAAAGDLPPTEATHTYPTPGDSTLTVTVKDSKGLTRSTSSVVSVAGAPSLSTPPTATVAHGTTFSLPVTSAAGGNDQIEGWTIEWGDVGPGHTVSGVGPPPATLTHTYTASSATPEVVTLSLGTGHGLVAQSTTSVTVT